MTEKTKNLELVKESEEEFYNVETVNENWDKVDAGFDKIKHCPGRITMRSVMSGLRLCRFLHPGAGRK